MKTYRCAIVGLTSIAAGPLNPTLAGGRSVLPYSHATAIDAIPNVEVTAVCDIVPAMTARFLENWKATWPGVRVYHDVDELFANEEIDILSVCTPDDRHADIVVKAANLGIKAILCEKPLATTLADADRMIEAIERNGTICNIEHTRRWDPFYHRVREMIDAGMIGDVKIVSAVMHGPRSMIFRNGTHLLDLMCYYAGSKPTHVFAETEAGFEDFAEYRGDGGHDPASEPSASAYIKFENGVRGFFDASKETMRLSQWTVAGTKGRIEIGPNKISFLVASDEVGEVVERSFPAGMVMKGGIQGAYEELIRVMEGKQDRVRSGPREARMTVSILEGILRSQQEGNRLVELR